MGVGILIPMDSPLGLILGIISLILISGVIICAIFIGISDFAKGIFGIFSEIKIDGYHKPDKNHKIAFLCSLFLPFSGNLYLRENKMSLIFTIISFFVMILTIYGLLTVPDFYLRNGYVSILLVVLWLTSLIILTIYISEYNKNKKYYSVNRKTELEVIGNNKILIAIPIILGILFLSINVISMTDTSDKIYENDFYSVNYPSNYYIDGENLQSKNGEIVTRFYINGRSDAVFSVCYADTHSSLEDYKKLLLDSYDNPIVKDKGTTTIGGVDACILEYEGEWIQYNFIKDNKVYTLFFKHIPQEDMDKIINSFKFK